MREAYGHALLNVCMGVQFATCVIALGATTACPSWSILIVCA